MSCASRLLGAAALLLWITSRAAAQTPLTEADNLRAEAVLLHHEINLSDVVGGNGPPPLPSAPVLVVHVWAAECVPCVKELPQLLQIIRAYAREPRVRFLLLSESEDEGRAQAILAAHKAAFLNVLIAHGGAHLRVELQDTTQPLTLILDSRRVVRQAFRGSLVGRRTLFTSALDRLLRLRSG